MQQPFIDLRGARTLSSWILPRFHRGLLCLLAGLFSILPPTIQGADLTDFVYPIADPFEATVLGTPV